MMNRDTSEQRGSIMIAFRTAFSGSPFAVMSLVLGCVTYEVRSLEPDSTGAEESARYTTSDSAATVVENVSSSSDGGPSGSAAAASLELDESTVGSEAVTPPVADDASSAIPVPLVGDDAYIMMQGEDLRVDASNGLLRNDHGDDGEILVVVEQVLTLTDSGSSIDLHADGSFEYLYPSMEAPYVWWGEEAFEYTVLGAHGGTNIGRVRLVVSPTIIPLEAVAAGVGGFAIDGEEPTTAFLNVRLSVADAGDVNQDGLDDVMLGAEGADPNGANSGRSYVVFGRTSDDDGVVSLALVTTESSGLIFDGEEPSDGAGESVDGNVDFNGDMFPDLLIGASGHNNGTGRSYVVFGTHEDVTIDNVIRGVGGFALDGQDLTDGLGVSISGVGDVNSDGLDDILVGAYGADPNPNAAAAGRSYVAFGRRNGLVSLNDIVEGNGGFVMDGEAANDISGSSVSGAGDFNGDGFADVIVGARSADPEGDFSGRSYVVFGMSRDVDGPLALADVSDGVGGFSLNGEAQNDQLGFSVCDAGDVNGDGFGDVVLSAPGHASGTGRSYVVFGRASGQARMADIVSGVGGFTLDGESASNVSGASVSGAGDVNGDGLADIIVGATGFGSNTGRSYVIFGKQDTSGVSLADVAEGNGGFALDGEVVGDRLGHSVSGAGDVNGDGFADIIVSANGADANGSGSGRSYVIFGGDFTLATTFRGTRQSEVFTGTPATESLVGGAGDDTLESGGGDDVLYGGSGNDTIILSDTNFFRVDGGTGSDTLHLRTTLDLFTVPDLVLRNVETIDITGESDVALRLALSDVFGLSETRVLTILGDDGDELIVDLSGGGFSRSNDFEFELFTSTVANVILRVAGDVDVSRVIGLVP